MPYLRAWFIRRDACRSSRAWPVALRRRPRAGTALGAYLHLIEDGARQVLVTEVVLVAIGRSDEAEAPLAVETHHFAVQRDRVLLLLAAQARPRLRAGASYRRRSRATRRMRLRPARGSRTARSPAGSGRSTLQTADPDADAGAFVTAPDDDPARHDVGIELFELVRLLDRRRLERLRRLHAVKADLKGELHRYFRMQCVVNGTPQSQPVCASATRCVVERPSAAASARRSTKEHPHAVMQEPLHLDH